MTQPLTIAMVHYHLRRGGVTRVIQNTLAALDGQAVSCVVLAGELPPENVSFSSPVRAVEGLGYAPSGEVDAEDLLTRTRAAARGALGRDPDLWHIHNHALGKNPAWTRAVAGLVAAGERVLLHVHDFAEDGRPALYRDLMRGLGDGYRRTLYPRGAGVHYACLNPRDLSFLQQAGGAVDRLHLLPNAVSTTDVPERASETEPLVLYPTRAIRRKNLGEFLLWSAVTPDLRFGVTLAPENPKERVFYDRWTAFAEEQRLPVDFEMGVTRDFNELMSSAQALATTSVAEGFGLAFLEPWMAGQYVVGRKLPEVTAALEESGLHLDEMYERLFVPANWISAAPYRERVAAAWRATVQAYDRPYREEDVERAVADAMAEDRIDFGKLDESMQEDVIARVRSSAAAATELSPVRLLPAAMSEERIKNNQRVVSDQYGLVGYGARLMRIYRAMSRSVLEPADGIDADRLLDQFLAPARFCLLRAPVVGDELKSH